MANADGTITLQTAVDTKGIKQGESQIKNSAQSMGTSFKRLGGIIATAFSIHAIKNFMTQAREAYKMQFEAEAKLAVVMRQRLGSTDKQIQSILDLTAAEQKMGVVGDEVQIAGAQQLATFVKEQSSLEKLIPAMNNVLVQQNGLNVSSSAAVGIANLFGKAMMGQASSLRRVGITFDEEQEKVLKYGNEEQRAAMLAQVITDNVGNMNYALAQTDFGKQQQLANQLGDIKEKFGQVVQQLEVAFIPLIKIGLEALEQFAETIKGIGDGIAEFLGIGKISDSLKDTVVQTNKATASTKKNTDALNNNTVANKKNEKAQKKSNKQIKRTIAHYDKLNVIQKQITKSAKATASKGTSTPVITDSMVPQGGTSIDSGANKMANDLNKALGKIEIITGAVMIALGLILLFTGHVGWGLAAIIFGMELLKKGAKNLGKYSEYEQYIETLKRIGKATGYALIALGIILLFAGQTLWGISGIVAGAILVWESYQIGDSGIEGQVDELLVQIGMVAGFALLGLGLVVMMLVPAHWLVGLGMVVAGVIAVGYAAYQAGKTGVSDEVKKRVALIMAIGGAALAGAGLLLMFLAKEMKAKLIGLGMFIAGCISYKKGVEMGKNLPWSKEAKDALVKYGTLAGAALVGAGVLLLFTQNYGVGLAMIGAGAAAVWGADEMTGGGVGQMFEQIGQIFLGELGYIGDRIVNKLKQLANSLLETFSPFYKLMGENGKIKVFDVQDDAEIRKKWDEWESKQIFDIEWDAIKKEGERKKKEQAENEAKEATKKATKKGKDPLYRPSNPLVKQSTTKETFGTSSMTPQVATAGGQADTVPYNIYMDGEVIAKGVAKRQKKHNRAKGKKK